MVCCQRPHICHYHKCDKSPSWLSSVLQKPSLPLQSTQSISANYLNTHGSRILCALTEAFVWLYPSRPPSLSLFLSIYLIVHYFHLCMGLVYFMANDLLGQILRLLKKAALWKFMKRWLWNNHENNKRLSYFAYYLSILTKQNC